MVQRVFVRKTVSKFRLQAITRLKKKNSMQNNRKRNSVHNDLHSLGRLQQNACSVWTRVWRSPQAVQGSTSQETTERKSPLLSCLSLAGKQQAYTLYQLQIRACPWFKSKRQDHRPWQVVKLPPHLPPEVLEQRASDWLSKQKMKGKEHDIQ